MHRRARALKRLQYACNDKLVSSENLLAFILPLVKAFIDNEMYHKYDYLMEDACNSIGSISYCLSWNKYYKTLDYYLKVLPKDIINPKLAIKWVLNSLPFLKIVSSPKWDCYVLSIQINCNVSECDVPFWNFFISPPPPELIGLLDLCMSVHPNLFLFGFEEWL